MRLYVSLQPTLWLQRVGFFYARRVGLVLGLWCIVPFGWAKAERCGFPNWVQKEVLGRVVSERPNLPFFKETADGRFRLHYTLSGSDAVPDIDGDGNGVPDYVDTAAVLLRYVFEVLVDSLGYPPPPSDGGEGGSGAYDVYFVDLGRQGLYGETVPERLLPQGVVPRFTSFLKLDNDYSPLDSVGGRATYRETGTRALRIAIAHEFYHAIQFGNYGIVRQGALLYELASTFMEWRLFPDTRDYEQFLPDLFQKPEQYVFGRADHAAAGYRFAIFGHYLYLRWGDGVMQRMWEHIGEGCHPYAALDTALREYARMGLPEVWCSFLPCLYYTGTRAGSGCFPQAADFPMVRFASVERFSPPAVIGSGRLLPFEFQFLQMLFAEERQTPDTLDVVLSNPNISAVLQGQLQGAGYVMSCGFVPDGEPIAGTRYSIRLQSESPLCRHLFWNTGFPFEFVEEVYPQPYVVGIHPYVCLPVPAAVPLEARGEVELYTLSSHRAATFSASVQIQERHFVCCIGPLELQPGVYVYRLSIAGQERWGKIVVQRAP